MLHFTPLESDPEIFTQLLHDLGGDECLRFAEVWSLDEESRRSLGTPLAIILIYPDEAPDTSVTDFEVPKGDDLFWTKQTINNACGFYAILHAVCNGDAARFIRPASILDDLLCVSKHAKQPLSAWIENSKPLQIQYEKAAKQGSTSVGAPEEEVEFHYVCFTRDAQGRLLLLDGNRDGPLVSTTLAAPSAGVLEGSNLALVQRFIALQTGSSHSLGMMALVSD